MSTLFEQIEAAMLSGSEFIGARAGWGEGKTDALVRGILLTAKQHPGTSQLLITDTHARLALDVWPEMLCLLGPLGWEYDGAARTWTDKATGSLVWVVAWRRHDRVNPLEGINVTSGRVFIDECQTLNVEVAKAAYARIRNVPGHQLVMAGLPLSEAWWIDFAESRGGTGLAASEEVAS